MHALFAQWQRNPSAMSDQHIWGLRISMKLPGIKSGIPHKLVNGILFMNNLKPWLNPIFNGIIMTLTMWSPAYVIQTAFTVTVSIICRLWILVFTWMVNCAQLQVGDQTKKIQQTIWIRNPFYFSTKEKAVFIVAYCRRRHFVKYFVCDTLLFIRNKGESSIFICIFLILR